MEYFNCKNVIYIKEENCFEDINIKEEVDDVEEDICVKNDKLINMKDDDSEIKQEIVNGTESGCQFIGIKEEAVDKDIKEAANHYAFDIHKEANYDDVNIKKEEHNFMDFEYERTSIDNDVVGNQFLPSLETSQEAQIHITSKAGEKKPFKCSDCNYSASCNSRLKRHIRIHTGEKPYKCDFCDHSAARKEHLKDHVRIHSDETIFKCDICEYETSEKLSLRKHIKSHIGDKPFKCDLCDYATASSSSLRRHIRIHTGEKPYHCTYCDYSASQKAHLLDHTRIHTGEKPFKCTYCDHCSAFKSDLQKHLRIHTGEKPFKCDFCDYRTADRSSLRKHTRIHTREMQCN